MVERPRVQALAEFYMNLLGLRACEPDATTDAHTVVLAGHPICGPRLVIAAVERTPDFEGYHRIALQVGNLEGVAELLAEQGIEHRRQQGWSYYDRRIELMDPAGNLLELVCSHPL